jgi:hypothetical protein
VQQRADDGAGERLVQAGRVEAARRVRAQAAQEAAALAGPVQKLLGFQKLLGRSLLGSRRRGG